jgi:hypothetical protein
MSHEHDVILIRAWALFSIEIFQSSNQSNSYHYICQRNLILNYISKLHTIIIIIIIIIILIIIIIIIILLLLLLLLLLEKITPLVPVVCHNYFLFSMV